METEEPITLTKWPFYVGDCLLVATALAIAILNNWALSDWQVVACVVAVALGAALFVLPHLVEYQTRVAEVKEGREGRLRALQRKQKQIEAWAVRMEERVRSLETAAGENEEEDRKTGAPAGGNRKRRGRGQAPPQLLHRAIGDQKSSDSSAVNRIIRSKTEEPES